MKPLGDSLKIKNLYQIGIALVLLGTGSYYFFNRPIIPKPKRDYNLGANAPCPGEKLELKMDDVFMRGLLEKGAPFSVSVNWFACNQAENNQLVYYRYSTKADPIVRRIVAREGDKFHLAKDESHKAWKLFVGGNEIKSVDGKPYFFGSIEAAPNLKVYGDAHDGILAKGHVILFSAFPPGEIDSGVYGVISTQDLVGIVTEINSLDAAPTKTEGSATPKNN